MGSTGNAPRRVRELLDAFRELRVAGIVASTNPADPEYGTPVGQLAREVPLVQLGPAAEPSRRAGLTL